MKNCDGAEGRGIYRFRIEVEGQYFQAVWIHRRMQNRTAIAAAKGIEVLQEASVTFPAPSAAK